MHSIPLTLNRVAIVTHPAQAEAGPLAREVAAYVAATAHVEVFTAVLEDEDVDPRIDDCAVDLIIAIGGDGTMLRASHIGGPLDIPILGINLGRLGFLTEVSVDRWQERLNQLFLGDYRLERRMMLHGEHWRGDLKLNEWEVLNELVLVRGRFVRPITLSVNLDCCPLVHYVADGVIVASATGSTAYSLAVGGPILMPELRNFLIIPISPHFSVERAFVLSEQDEVSIRLDTEHEAVISPDGRRSVMVETGDVLKVCASRHSVSFVRFSSQADFSRNLLQYMEKNPIAVKMEEQS